MSFADVASFFIWRAFLINNNMVNITIDQYLALRYNLSLQESLLMGFLMIKLNSNKFIFLDKSEITHALPVLPRKHDTIYRYLKNLMNVGLIEFENNDSNYLKLSVNIY